MDRRIIKVKKYNLNETTVSVVYSKDGRIENTIRSVSSSYGIEKIVFDREVYRIGEWRKEDNCYVANKVEIVRKRIIKSSVEKKEVEVKGVEEEGKENVEEHKEVKCEEVRRNEDGEVLHKEYDTIFECVKMDIPVFLTGPAGSGKNHVLEQVAWDLGLDFYFTNSVQQEYKLTGFIDAGGVYHETEFYKAFKNGGLFFLDEMDASIPEVLILLNAAIANRYFEFPNGRINANKDFRVVASGNTVGNGADELYVGRLQLDQATLDRFVIVEFDYDRNIELGISGNNVELVDFIHSLRKQSEEKGINTTFSYRCISMVSKLEKGTMEIPKILRISVFKGLDKDTVNTFTVEGSNKYWDGLKDIQNGTGN